MNVSEKIIAFLEKRGVKHCFTVNGGHSMFLGDALFRSKIKPIFCHNEQAAGMAAEAYGRLSGLGVVMVTAGPGVINCLNGVVGAWVDSTPMIVLSGANYANEVEYLKKNNMRQVGLQGVNTEAIVKSIVKDFHTLQPEDCVGGVDDILQTMYDIATTDRKGPVWLEVPLNIQNLS